MHSVTNRSRPPGSSLPEGRSPRSHRNQFSEPNLVKAGCPSTEVNGGQHPDHNRNHLCYQKRGGGIGEGRIGERSDDHGNDVTREDRGDLAARFSRHRQAASPRRQGCEGQVSVLR